VGSNDFPPDTNLLLVRHAETEANANGRFVGRGHSDFSEEGLRQMRRLPAKIARFAPERVWSSPLQRALVLGRRASRAAGVPLEVDERLLELDFGVAEGLNAAEIKAAGIAFNYQNAAEPVAPEGESRDAIEARSGAFAAELTARGGRFAVVTHGGVFRAMLVELLGLERSDIWAFHIHNAQLAHVRVVDGHGMLEEYVQG